MDPTANLREQRAIADRFIAVADGKATPDDFDAVGEGIELAELVIAYTDWIASGGFTPRPLPRTVPIDKPEAPSRVRPVTNGYQGSCDPCGWQGMVIETEQYALRGLDVHRGGKGHARRSAEAPR